MTVKPNPAKPGYYDIDCRPWGYRGKRVRETIKAESLEAAQAWENLVMRREDQTPQTRPARTCSSIFASYKAWYKINRAASSYKDLLSVWKHQLQPVFGSKAPRLLTRPLIEQYKAARIGSHKRGQTHLATVSKRTVNKELNLLSGMLSWAAEQGLCEELAFRIKGFERNKTRPKKPRPLTPAQVSAVWQAIEPDYKLIFLLMADAGLRRAEAYRLRRRQVDLEHGVLYVIGKGDKERLVPIMTPRLSAELEKRKGLAPDAWLSVNPQTKKPYHDIKKALKRAAAAAGLEQHLHNHLLRHSFGTNATAAGVDANAVKDILGHADLATTQLYQHLAGDYLRAQGAKFAALAEAPAAGRATDTWTKNDSAENGGKTAKNVHMDSERKAGKVLKLRRKTG